MPCLGGESRMLLAALRAPICPSALGNFIPLQNMHHSSLYLQIEGQNP